MSKITVFSIRAEVYKMPFVAVKIIYYLIKAGAKMYGHSCLLKAFYKLANSGSNVLHSLKVVLSNYNYMASFSDRLKHLNIVRKLVYVLVGCFSYPGLAIINRLKIYGTEHFSKLPNRNVLFVSNHQTYFADVITFLHIFCAVKWGKKNKLGIPYYLLNPFTKVYFVSAEETMKKSWLTKLFALAGALTVKRAWLAKSAGEKQKGLNPGDTRQIARALENNWVITFPQGTTKAFAPGRKGTALIIKQTKPVVIPVVISGFWRAFDKKGLKFKKKGTLLSVRFKEPLNIDYDASTETILAQLMDAIEQSKEYMMKGAHHWKTEPAL